MIARLCIGLATAVLAACGSSPRPTLHTLAEEVRAAAPMKAGVSIAVMAASLPEAHDRLQIVVRGKDNRLLVIDQQRWSEPLRQEIARQVATDLGCRLGSGGVVALPEDVQSLDPGYRLLLDVQRLDASLTEGVGVDVAWRLVARDGKVYPGRSVQLEPVGVAGDAPYTALAAAYRRAFGRVSADVATLLGGLPSAAR